MKLKLLSGVIVTSLATAAYLFLPASDKDASYSPRDRDVMGQLETGFKGAGEMYLEMRGNINTGQYEVADMMAAEKAIRDRGTRRAAPLGLNLEVMGPDNQGGRTRAVLVERGNSDRVYAGGVSGGLFISDDGAGTFVPHPDLTNDLSSSAIIASLAEGPNGEIYVGTGSNFDAFANSLGIPWAGKGMFVSLDKGESFQSLPSTFPSNLNTSGEPWNTVNRIAVNQSNGTIYAATNRGLQMSTDGGQTWMNPVYLDPAQTIPATGICHDVVIADNGAVLCVIGGSTFHSPNGLDQSFSNVTSNGLAVGTRVVLAMAPSDNDYVYAITTQGGDLGGIYQSKDGGLNWSLILQPIPDFFQPLNGQGVYDLALGVDPNNRESILIGGLELWRWDGNLTRIASDGGGQFNQFSVHADKHLFYWDPNNGQTLYVASDGGLSKSLNNGETFLTVHKGYITTQFYGVAYTVINDFVIGGTQDNGTWLITSQNPNDPLNGSGINGGDGFDCNISQIAEVGFATSQFSVLVRGGFNPPFANINTEGFNGPFWTITQLWETLNDSLSQDSIVFRADPVELGIGVGNAVKRTFTGSVSPTQQAGEIVSNSLQVRAGQVVLDNSANDSLLAGDGGSGTVSQNADGSLSITVSFNDPPSTNLIIRASFDVRYPANSVLNLASLTEELPIDHVLSTNMEPGDEIKVQDPVQSLVGLSISGGFALSRGALRLNETPQWMTFTNIGNVRAMEFTDDGNHLFVSSGGSVYRISGLSRLYSEDQISQVTTTTRIFTGNAFVTGIAIDPNDQNRILITRGNYGVADHVHLVTDALTRTSDANQILTSVQGDLPAMPVYDAEFNVNNSSEVLIGTEFGVWATDDITNANVEWSDENNEVGYTPTYDIRQQKLPYTRAQNHGVFYIGTHGRGIWKTSSLVGIDDDVDDRVSGNVDFVSDVTVYPNPMAGEGNIVFNLTERTTAEVNIMDLQGRIVRTFGKRSYEAGDNQLGINTSDLPMGTYFVTVATATDRKVNKFVVVK